MKLQLLRPLPKRYKMRVVDIINPTLQKYFGSESGETVMVFPYLGFRYPWSDSSVMYSLKYKISIFKNVI